MTNAVREQEVWKQYPDYDFIEVSNLGRVRTKDRTVTYKNGKKYHYKGRVLKQKLQKNGYMQVCICMNGKRVWLFVHRMVAITFIPNPNNYPQVNHIDNDRTNNSASNLEWCTPQYNNDYRKNFGTSPAQIFGHHVYAVDLKTGKVLIFKSQREAGRQLGIDPSNIAKVAKGQQVIAGGYWFTEDDSEITEKKIQEIKASAHFFCGVIVVNLDNFKVLWFKSQSEAACKLNISAQSINSVVKGRQDKACGYWFCYADENAVEKVRAKFGDKVAKKVEELMDNES